MRSRYSVTSCLFPIQALSNIFSGAQRYSFVLNANQKISNYWVRAQPKFAGSNEGYINATNSAILRYVGALADDPTTNSTITQPLFETNLHPLVPSTVPGAPYPGGADVNLNLEITFNTTDLRFFINNAVCAFWGDCGPELTRRLQTFIPPTAPVLLQILSGAHTA
jgi:iron transport multicopper oxidase